MTSSEILAALAQRQTKSVASQPTSAAPPAMQDLEQSWMASTKGVHSHGPGAGPGGVGVPGVLGLPVGAGAGAAGLVLAREQVGLGLGLPVLEALGLGLPVTEGAGMAEAEEEGSTEGAADEGAGSSEVVPEGATEEGAGLAEVLLETTREDEAAGHSAGGGPFLSTQGQRLLVALRVAMNSSVVQLLARTQGVARSEMGPLFLQRHSKSVAPQPTSLAALAMQALEHSGTESTKVWHSQVPPHSWRTANGPATARPK